MLFIIISVLMILHALVFIIFVPLDILVYKGTLDTGISVVPSDVTTLIVSFSLTPYIEKIESVEPSLIAVEPLFALSYFCKPSSKNLLIIPFFVITIILFAPGYITDNPPISSFVFIALLPVALRLNKGMSLAEHLNAL